MRPRECHGTTASGCSSTGCGCCRAVGTVGWPCSRRTGPSRSRRAGRTRDRRGGQRPPRGLAQRGLLGAQVARFAPEVVDVRRVDAADDCAEPEQAVRSVQAEQVAVVVLTSERHAELAGLLEHCALGEPLPPGRTASAICGALSFRTRRAKTRMTPRPLTFKRRTGQRSSAVDTTSKRHATTPLPYLYDVVRRNTAGSWLEQLRRGTESVVPLLPGGALSPIG